MRFFFLIIYSILMLLFLVSCGEKKDQLPLNLRAKPIVSATINTPPGADPSVSAKNGGKGLLKQ